MDGGAPARRLSGGNVSKENIRSLRRTSAASAFCRPAKNLNLKETVMYGYPSDFIINE